MDENPEVNRMPSWIVPAMVILAIVSIGGIGFAWYDSNQVQMAEQTNGQLKTAEQNTAQQVATLEQKQKQAEVTNVQLQSDLDVVTKKLRVTQGDLKKARDEAAQIQHRSDDAQKLAQMDTDVKNQLATKASTDELMNATNGTVSGVKTDLEGTKNDLKMARSELGTLIARNHDEIDRCAGWASAITSSSPFRAATSHRRSATSRVELRSVNTKKNQFSVAVVLDDVRTEKKDRTVNEPIVFYPNGSHQADELVVNQVGKDKISGYISTPKNPGTPLPQAHRATSASRTEVP